MLKKPLIWRPSSRGRRLRLTLVGLILVVGLFTAVTLIRTMTDPRNQTFLRWWRGSAAERQSLVTIQREACPGAPFILPADGYIGLLYGDPRGPYSRFRPHQGIDIFSPGAVGQTPVYAAYDGYVTREADWRSTLIQRVPDDPLQPGRQLWLYYTHMAHHDSGEDTIEEAFAPGVRELFVPQGTLLGYTGNYNGDSPRQVGVHLHFSIVLDDGRGGYRNELDIANTLDPSPYLGMSVHYACAPAVPSCTANPLCPAARSGS
ncbi:MAG: hypothetical protein AB1791_13360 [Chloroflexota bacterium]